MASVRSRNSQGKAKDTPKEAGTDAHDPNAAQDVEPVVTPKTVVVDPVTKEKSVAAKSTHGISSVKGGGSQADSRKRAADVECDGKKTPKKTVLTQKEQQRLEKAEADYQKLIRDDEEKTKRDDAAKVKRAAELAAKAPHPAGKPATGMNRAPAPARLEGAGRVTTLNDGNYDFHPTCIFSQTIRNQRYYPVRRLYRTTPIARPTQNSFPVLHVLPTPMPPPGTDRAWTGTPCATSPVPGPSLLPLGRLMFRRNTWHVYMLTIDPDCAIVQAQGCSPGAPFGLLGLPREQRTVWCAISGMRDLRGPHLASG